MAKKLIRGVQGVENIYTQHVPAFKGVLENVAKGKPDSRLRAYGPNPQSAQVFFFIFLFVINDK